MVVKLVEVEVGEDRRGANANLRRACDCLGGQRLVDHNFDAVFVEIGVNRLLQARRELVSRLVGLDGSDVGAAEQMIGLLQQERRRVDAGE